MTAEIAHTCGHPSHGASDHDCTPFLPCNDPACPCGPKAENAQDRAALVATRALHVSSQETRGVGRHVRGQGWTPYCEADLEDWPCPTVELLPADLRNPPEGGGDRG